MSPWWESHDRHATPETRLSAAALTLLEEVRVAFLATGADTPGWPDPHLDPDASMGRRDPAGEEYERCREPERHRLTQARGAAWVQVLHARGAVSTLTEHRPAPGRAVLTLQPEYTEQGARPLVLKHEYFIFDNGHAPCLEVWAGDPALRIVAAPDCACDACDSGSADLLEMIDKAVFSVVDGSVTAVTGPRSTWLRTSFEAQSTQLGATIRSREVPTVELRAGPWFPAWNPRDLSGVPSGWRGPGRPGHR